MKTTTVLVNWPKGLHARRAAQLVHLARRFHSNIQLRIGSRCANARSLLSILILSAGLGAPIEIEASGNDESEAIRAMERFFSSAGTKEQAVV